MLALFSQQNIRGKLRGRFGYASLRGFLFLKTCLRLYGGSMEETNDQMKGQTAPHGRGAEEEEEGFPTPFFPKRR